jgi:predicted metal-dependent peptidase
VFEPGRQRSDHRPRIVIGVDTSSSILPQTLRLLVAEAHTIARRTGAEAHLLAFDETVFSQTRLDQTGWANLQTGHIPTNTWRTGGGTDYADLFTQAAKLHPSIAIILTDLDAALPPAPGFAVIWAVPNAVPNAVPPPAYGRVLRVADGQIPD